MSTCEFLRASTTAMFSSTACYNFARGTTIVTATLTGAEVLAASALTFFASPIIISYFSDRVFAAISPALVLAASLAATVAMATWLNRRARWHADEAGAVLSLMAIVFAWLLWIARPAFVPLGHGPDLTHHLLLVDFIARRWQLPHDPAMEGYLGEFFHYTPGAHLLTSLAGAWLHVGGFR